MKKELMIFSLGFVLATVGISLYETSLSSDIHIRIPKDDFAKVCQRDVDNSPEVLVSACRHKTELTLSAANTAPMSQHHHELNLEE